MIDVSVEFFVFFVIFYVFDVDDDVVGVDWIDYIGVFVECDGVGIVGDFVFEIGVNDWWVSF